MTRQRKEQRENRGGGRCEQHKHRAAVPGGRYCYECTAKRFTNRSYRKFYRSHQETREAWARVDWTPLEEATRKIAQEVMVDVQTVLNYCGKRMRETKTDQKPILNAKNQS